MVKFRSLTVVISFIILQNNYCASQFSKIDSILIKKLEEEGKANIFVHMAEGTDLVLNNIKQLQFISRADRLNSVTNQLKIQTEKSQKPVAKFLTQNSVSYKSFWICNQIYIPAAKLSLVQKLSNLPAVSKITEEIIVQLEKPLELPPTERKDNSSDISGQRQWGIWKIQADRVWSHTNGTLGKGAIVGSIDTGVRHTHVALRNNFRRDYGWYDAISNRLTPYDDLGHGTHVMGTIVGGEDIGVAPEAEWIACKAGNIIGQFKQDWLMECGQFILCPTLANGTSPDCSKAPHLVSNSWGGSGGNSFYDDVTNAWITAGIIPFFSIGNSGPDCQTTKSPGDRNVIAVGATTLIDSLAYFSSRGTPGSNYYNFKPDISAPGADILSASSDGDSLYVKMSGTSMACPHVAGMGALLVSLKNDIKYDEMKNILFSSTETNKLLGLKDYCGNSPGSMYPNNAFGYGRINAYKSAMNLLQLPSASVTVSVNLLVLGGVFGITIFIIYFFNVNV